MVEFSFYAGAPIVEHLVNYGYSWESRMWFTVLKLTPCSLKFHRKIHCFREDKSFCNLVVVGRCKKIHIFHESHNCIFFSLSRISVITISYGLLRPSFSFVIAPNKRYYYTLILYCIMDVYSRYGYSIAWTVIHLNPMKLMFNINFS